MNEAMFAAQVQEDATENKAKEDYYTVARQISETITKQPLIVQVSGHSHPFRTVNVHHSQPNTPTVPVLLISAPTSSSSNTATPFPPHLFYP